MIDGFIRTPLAKAGKRVAEKQAIPYLRDILIPVPIFDAANDRVKLFREVFCLLSGCLFGRKI